MEWLKDKAQIVTRDDGSFVIKAMTEGKYEDYHVTPEYCPELYAEVVAFLESKTYAAGQLPAADDVDDLNAPEPPVVEEPGV